MHGRGAGGRFTAGSIPPALYLDLASMRTFDQSISLKRILKVVSI